MVLLLEVHRRAVSQSRMAAAWVLPAFDPGRGRQSVFGLGLEAEPVDQFALHAGKETLSHHVVVGVAPAFHRRAHAHRLAALPEGEGRVLPWSEW